MCSVKYTLVARVAGCDGGRDIMLDQVSYVPGPHEQITDGLVRHRLRSFYFFPTAAKHFPYNSSKWVAYSSGFAADPVP